MTESFQTTVTIGRTWLQDQHAAMLTNVKRAADRAVQAARRGDDEAAEKLLALMYRDLAIALARLHRQVFGP